MDHSKSVSYPPVAMMMVAMTLMKMVKVKNPNQPCQTSDGRLDVVVDHTQRISGTMALHHQSISSEDNGGGGNVDSLFQICVWPQSPKLFHSQENYIWNVFVENPLLVSKSEHGLGSVASHGIIKALMPGNLFHQCINWQFC